MPVSRYRVLRPPRRQRRERLVPAVPGNVGYAPMMARLQASNHWLVTGEAWGANGTGYGLAWTCTS